LGDQIKKNEESRSCSTYGGRGELRIGFYWGNLREGKLRHILEDNIKMDIREVDWEGMDWIDLA
jgi:hypothetical protein